MSDSRPIGIFDSGLGGLTVAKEIYKILPDESTVYIGDTARVPYGNRSQETVVRFSLELADKLLEHKVKAIVVACATASSLALDKLAQTYPTTPIIGMIQPAIESAITLSKLKNIGLIGTRATINSKSFEYVAKKLDPSVTLYPQACPLFVPLIEEGFIDKNPILSAVVEYYLSGFASLPLDSLILGCTHYPIIEASIQSYLPKVKLINAGVSVAHSLKQLLNDADLRTCSTNPPQHKYFVTDKNDNFSTTARLFLNQNINIEKIAI